MQQRLYSDNFKEIIKFSKDNGFYVGTGNHAAKMLIIGKEASIDIEKNPIQHDIEFTNNAIDWENNITNNVQITDIRFQNEQAYNPIYPYRGQKNKIEHKATGHNGGTSRTYFFYQNLIDQVFNNGKKSETINFHEQCFITELNQITSPYSHRIPKKVRAESIAKRHPFFRQTFFQKFPIVVVATGHYVRDFNIDLEALFNVKFISPTIDLGGGNWINIHHGIVNGEPKLLIHTNQLSMIKSILIDEIAKICKKWIGENEK